MHCDFFLDSQKQDDVYWRYECLIAFASGMIIVCARRMDFFLKQLNYGKDTNNAQKRERRYLTSHLKDAF